MISWEIWISSPSLWPWNTSFVEWRGYAFQVNNFSFASGRADKTDSTSKSDRQWASIRQSTAPLGLSARGAEEAFIKQCHPICPHDPKCLLEKHEWHCYHKYQTTKTVRAFRGSCHKPTSFCDCTWRQASFQLCSLLPSPTPKLLYFLSVRDASYVNMMDSFYFPHSLFSPRASLMVQMVKNPLAKWETWVRSLGSKDPVEKGMATHSSILAWGIPRTEEPGGPQSMGSQRVRHNWAIFTYSVHIQHTCV